MIKNNSDLFTQIYRQLLINPSGKLNCDAGVEVVDITFETLKYDDDTPVRFDANGFEYDDGDITMWGRSLSFG